MAEVYEKPWIEKYRPEFLEDVVGKLYIKSKIIFLGNREVIMQLKNIAQLGNVPNMIMVVIYNF
jgi:hypothetical protein